jgi:hypothetical protein
MNCPVCGNETSEPTCPVDGAALAQPKADEPAADAPASDAPARKRSRR